MISVIPGTENIKSITIVNEDNNTFIEASLIAQSVTILESVDSFFTTAVITITDQNDILGRLPILGHELVEIIWETVNKAGISGTNESKKDSEIRNEVFRITNISSVQPTDSGNPGLIYELNLISEFAFLQEFVTIDTAFSNTVSNCVKAVHDSALKTPIGDIKLTAPNIYKLNKLDSTEGVVDFIAPNDTPFNIIEMLQSWAFSNENLSNTFYYFQNKAGYNFRALDSLAREEVTPDKKYYYSNDGTNAVLRNFETNRISNFIAHNRGNAFELASEGRLCNQVAEIDYIKKTINVTNYSYDQNASKYNIFGSKVFASKKFMENIGSVPTQTHWIFKDSSKQENYYSQALKHKWAMHKLIYNNLLSIVVPGSSNLTAGDVIDVKIPHHYSAGKSSQNLVSDEFLSGKYIAKDVVHHLNREGYTCQVNLFRTGSKNQLNKV